MEYIVSYRIVSREKPSYRIDIVSNRKKAYRYWLIETLPGSSKEVNQSNRQDIKQKELQFTYCADLFQTVNWGTNSSIAHSSHKYKRMCRGVVSLFPALYSRHKCIGNLDLGSLPVVTTMVQPGKERRAGK